MSDLSKLKPTVKRRVIDLVKTAGVNVDDWANFKGENPSTNPKYCYEWAFVEPGKVVVLNLWFEDMKEENGRILQNRSFRTKAHDTSTRRRAKIMEQAIQKAFIEGLPIRAIVNDGDMRDRHGFTQASRVNVRQLDPMPWRVTAYDNNTGSSTLIRDLTGDQDAVENSSLRIDRDHIDPYLFQQQFEAFKEFVSEQSGLPFASFASNPYTEEQEGYKYEIHRNGREILAFQTWKESDIGSGSIAEAVLKAIEIPKNNLVPWQGRFGEEARPHQPIFEAKEQSDKMQKIERCFFRLYHKQENETSFEELTDIFGKKYPLLAYFFFLKDRSKYLPIAPRSFDRAFEHLGVGFKTNQLCSWKNYLTYIDILTELKTMLAESLAGEVSLLDAHSFAWMLARQMERQNKLADVREYLELSSTEREAIVKARIGQGRFRESLINYWGTCAITSCGETKLLRASHIKPWAKSELKERLNLYNGLLLSPTLDACFDSGYISFDDKGGILISKRLTTNDAIALGVSPNMRLKRIATEHKEYLAFHRKHIFK